MVLNLLNNIWLVFLDTAFWLLIGLLAAGFIKSFIHERSLSTIFVQSKALKAIHHRGTENTEKSFLLLTVP